MEDFHSISWLWIDGCCQSSSYFPMDDPMIRWSIWQWFDGLMSGGYHFPNESWLTKLTLEQDFDMSWKSWFKYLKYLKLCLASFCFLSGFWWSTAHQLWNIAATGRISAAIRSSNPSTPSHSPTSPSWRGPSPIPWRTSGDRRVEALENLPEFLRQKMVGYTQKHYNEDKWRTSWSWKPQKMSLK